MPEEIRADLLLGRDTLSPGLVKAGEAASKASGNVRQLTRDLYEISKQRATPVVDLNDATAAAKLKDVSAKLTELGKRVADPGVELQDKEAEASLAAMRVKLDALGRKVSSPRVTLEGLAKAEAGILALDVQLDRLSRKHATPSVSRGLLSRLGGLLGGLGGGSGGAGAAGIAGLGPVGIGAAAAGALALGPAAIPAIAGTGLGLFGAILGDPKGIKTIFAQIAGDIRSALAPLKPLFDSVFKQFGDFIKDQGPQLRQLFRASVPDLSAFVKIMEQFAIAVLPAVTQSLKELKPSLPILIQGFKYLSEGIAGFIINLGPGIKASAIIFKAAMLVVKGFLQITGLAASDFALAIVKTAETVRAIARDIPRFFDAMAHEVMAILNGLSRAAGAAWHILWTATVSAVRSGIRTVVGFFTGLSPQVLRALFGLGHQLYAFAHAALNEFWDGLKAVAGSVISWVGNFVSAIWDKVKSFFGINSPSALFYDAGKNLMLGLFHGIRDHAHHAANAAKAAQGAVSGALGGDALANQALARKIFPWGADQWGPFVSLVMAESGFNRFARNPTSGAYGIPQALPPTKLPFAGQAAGGSHAGPQLSWMFNYIAQRYGNPAGAWAHEVAQHWYGSGLDRGIFTRPTLIGVGERGPEMVSVTPLGSGGGTATVVLEVRSGGAPADALLAEFIRRYVRVRGGNVQTVFGRN